MTDISQSDTDLEAVDHYWSFRSHYCYLGLDRTIALEDDYRVRLNVRPVYPLAIRMPSFFTGQPEDPKRWQYVVRDSERLADMLNIPFAWPDPDPVVIRMHPFEIPADQPYIHRLTCLGIAACRRGRGLAFTAGVARLIWGGTRHWDRGDKLAMVARTAGLDLREMLEDIESQSSSYLEEIRGNEAALAEAGHWGVPTLVFRGEPFFGQDRISVCRWRLSQAGLDR